MKGIILLILLLVNSFVAFNQAPNVIFNQVTREEGVSEYGIRAITQDHKGFIWIGGGYGQGGHLQRYDGYEFIDYDQISYPVRNITEDSRGFLWMGTENGICLMIPELEKTIHYNPVYETFTDYFSVNFIYKIIEDNNGNIWCATGNGLLKMTPVNKDEDLKASIVSGGLESAFSVSVYKPYETDTTEGINAIYDIIEASGSRIWLGGIGGLFVFDNTTNVCIRVDDDNGKSNLIHPHVVGIIEEDPDVLWISTYKGFNRIFNIAGAFSGSQLEFTDLKYEHYYYYEDKINYYDFIHENVRNPFLLDNQNNVWFESNLNIGLATMSISGNEMGIIKDVNIITPSAKSTVFSSNIQSFLQDHTGLIWVTSYGSEIGKFRNSINIFTSKESMLERADIRYDFEQLIEDSDGNLLVCNYAEGVFEIRNTGEVYNYKPTIGSADERLRGSYTTAILEIGAGDYLVGAYDIWQLNTAQGTYKKFLTLNDWVYDLQKIDHYLLIKTYEQGLWVYDMMTNDLDNYTVDQKDTMGLRTNYYASINIMKNGEIWIGSRWLPGDSLKNGIARMKLDQSTGDLEFLPLQETVTKNDKILFKDERKIYKIYENTEGLLWFCTNLGLVRLDPVSGAIREWTTKDGLSSNYICSVEEDNKGNLWLATRYGLSMLDPVTERIRTFNEKDGLPDVMTAYGRSSFKNRKGHIYISGVNGFYSINPDMLYHNDSIPPVVITHFRLSNNPVQVDSSRKALLSKNIAYTQELSLAYNQNDLSFAFSALDYNDPAKNRYAYKLEGYQDEWVETDADNRTATYTNLSPGDYIFKVKGSNNDGVWNEEGTFIYITIHPPFWKTIWAYIAYGIILLLLLRGYIFWRTRRLRKEKIILEEQVSERTQQIEQQKDELKSANSELEKNQNELQEVNTLLEEQQEELMQQKEELQSTLESLQKTQEQLIESEKMAAVGGLVAGVAHEMNTPVGIGITAISNLQDDVGKMSDLYEKDEITRKDFKSFLESTNDTAKLIHKNLERAASLIQSFKQVSTDQVTEQKRVFTLKEYLEDILLSLRPKFRGKDIDFKIDCDDELKLNSYPGVFAQIFTNMLLNSLQHGFYKKEKGTITVQAVMLKNTLKIRYLDDGAGISKKDLPHIFEPFYTSDQHRGTGLGLNIIYNLIRQKLHGTITCESEQSKGVLFEIEVPAE